MFAVVQNLIKKGQFSIFVYFFGIGGVNHLSMKFCHPHPLKKIKKKVDIKLNKELQTEWELDKNWGSNNVFSRNRRFHSITIISPI